MTDDSLRAAGQRLADAVRRSEVVFAWPADGPAPSEAAWEMWDALVAWDKLVSEGD